MASSSSTPLMEELLQKYLTLKEQEDNRKKNVQTYNKTYQEKKKAEVEDLKKRVWQLEHEAQQHQNIVVQLQKDQAALTFGYFIYANMMKYYPSQLDSIIVELAGHVDDAGSTEVVGPPEFIQLLRNAAPGAVQRIQSRSQKM
jgi:chromosome segregation ATPase